jgi:ABC-type bacteriocin/lantibiotic exporter with double-glycine peptidase domain
VSESKAVHIIENIPFYPQEVYQCGPSSLSGVLNYYGVDVSPEDIAQQIYSASAKGTLNVDMILYAEKKGLTAHQYESSFQDIKSKVHSSHPLIVMVDYGFWIYQRNHFMVVVGYNEDGIIANSGREQFKFIPLRDFLKSWKRTEFWSLLITPLNNE